MSWQKAAFAKPSRRWGPCLGMLRVWVPRARLHGDVEPRFNAVLQSGKGCEPGPEGERCPPQPCRCPALVPQGAAALGAGGVPFGVVPCAISELLRASS